MGPPPPDEPGALRERSTVRPPERQAALDAPVI